ncbi:MAG: carbohydrate kinase family protein [Nocardioidaceae bacterium]|nr:carbohydrate kinase family protein [Nocardioidaceae bacterium]
MLVACLGDVMLDVLVETEAPLASDDDTPARITLTAGGQAANVATWAVALGGRARVFGPRPDTGTGHLVERSLTERGVEVRGTAAGRTGAVLSLLHDGHRTMASDPGDLGWLDEVRSGAWLEDASWLFVSGYALLRTPDPQRIVQTAAVARAHGTRVAVDYSSASMVERFGARRFTGLCEALRPSVVFATDAEWRVAGGSFGAGGTAVLVLKHGQRGASFVIDGMPDLREPHPGPVVDVTGAGDALAAGYLVGGVDLAMEAAAQCVAQRGAQPGSP